MEKPGSRTKKLNASQKIAMMAGAAGAVSPALSTAAVVYVGNSPLSISWNDSPNTVVNWDVDGSGEIDFRMRAGRYSLADYGLTLWSRYVDFSSAGNGRGLVNSDGGIRGLALQNGLLVGPTMSANYQWGNTGARRAASSFSSRICSYTYGSCRTNSGSGPAWGFTDFTDGENLFGFRFEEDGNIHYGWAEMVFSGSTVTISRWAYESTPNTGIRVGATSTVPLPGSLGLLATGAAGLLALRRRRESSLANSKD